VLSPAPISMHRMSAGVSNSFLVSTRSKEALLYNDNSVNENGHAATAFRLLAQPSCNFAKDFEPEEFRFFRQLVIAISEPFSWLSNTLQLFSNCNSVLLAYLHAKHYIK